MKRILIITLALIFGLSAVGLAAGTFSGRWVTDFTITTPQTPVIGMSSTLTVNYAVAGWTFGSVSTLTRDGWTEQDFRADGKLGAFDLTNHLRFVPAPAAFTFLRSTVAVPLAGIDFEARFLVVGPLPAILAAPGVTPADAALAGTGLRLRVGDWPAFMRATAYFGSLAFDHAVAWTAPRDHRTHELLFRGLDVDFRVPFHSFILTIDADFSAAGFDDLTLTVPAFPLGIPGFTLGASVTYSLAAKTVTLTPAIALTGLGLHFVPFISIDSPAIALDGLRLEGLRMTWAVDPRVTFIYEWDAPGLPGEIAGTGNQQRIRIDAAMAPITFTSAFAWRHDPADMPMFPQWIDLDISAVVLPGLSLRTGVDIRAHLLHAITFGFTVDW